MGDYHRLEVWRRAHGLGCDLYRLARSWEPADRYTLGDQVRRASISVGAAIAEGCGRNGDGELARYLNISQGSANELSYLIEFARDTDVMLPPTAAAFLERSDEVRRMLAGFHRTVARRRGK